MQYVAQTRNDIIVAKFLVSDDYVRQDNELTLTKQQYEDIQLPCTLEFEPVNEWPTWETQTFEIPEPEPSTEDDLTTMVVNHEYKLTLLELGLSE